MKNRFAILYKTLLMCSEKAFAPKTFLVMNTITQKEDFMGKKRTGAITRYVIGSIILAGISIIVFPRIIEAVSSFAYRKVRRTPVIENEEDWGPEIVKKNKGGEV